MGVKKVCCQCHPYLNCVTLKGQLSNWTSEDVVAIATENIETIIAPIRNDLAEQTYWNKIGESTDKSNENNSVLEFKNIGDSLENGNESNNENEDYEWQML